MADSESVPFPGRAVRGSSTGQPVMALFDLLGRAWGMGIVWQLQKGPCTFRELQARCDGVSPSVLNKRLKELRETGFVELGESGFALTSLGTDLFDHLEPLGVWARTWARELTGE